MVPMPRTRSEHAGAASVKRCCRLLGRTHVGLMADAHAGSPCSNGEMKINSSTPCFDADRAYEPEIALPSKYGGAGGLGRYNE
jgi:hypothetical protein